MINIFFTLGAVERPLNKHASTLLLKISGGLEAKRTKVRKC